jgi:large subunit ribosomal protein L16
MNFIPKDKKYPKIFKFRLKKEKKIEHRTIRLIYGNYGLKALSSGILTVKHFEILRLSIRRSLKKRGKFWFRIFPYTFTTKKPLEVRMGKGKGNHFQWIAPIKIGQILLEFKLRRRKFLEILFILRKCKKRLPLKCQIISKSKKLLKNNLEKNYNKIF